MTFRRTGWRLLPWYLYLAFCWALTGLFAASFFIAIFLKSPWNAERVITILLIGLLVYPTAKSALSAHSWIREFRRNYLAVDERGVRFRLPDTSEIGLGWSDIESIASDKRWLTFQGIWAFTYRTWVHTMVTRSGTFRFTSMEIPRARRAAIEIAMALAARDTPERG